MILEVLVVERQIADPDGFQPELRPPELRQGQRQPSAVRPLAQAPDENSDIARHSHISLHKDGHSRPRP